jgi:hypothetical protein
MVKNQYGQHSPLKFGHNLCLKWTIWIHTTRLCNSVFICSLFSKLLFPFQNSPDLVSEDTIRRLAVPLESALTLLSQAPTILKAYLGELKPLLAMVRLRLFETLSLLPPNCLDGSYAQLLRLLVRRTTLVTNKVNIPIPVVRHWDGPELCIFQIPF